MLRNSRQSGAIQNKHLTTKQRKTGREKDASFSTNRNTDSSFFFRELIQKEEEKRNILRNSKNRKQQNTKEHTLHTKFWHKSLQN